MADLITIDEKAKTVTIVLPLNPAGTLTKNGNSRLIASTHGTMTVFDKNQKPVRVGVNVTMDK